MKLKNPFSRLQDQINHDIYERFIHVFDFHSISSQIYEDVLEKINTTVKEMTPELLVNYVDTYRSITQLIEKSEKTLDSIVKKSNKLFDSSSLAEDVYKMRDEMKGLKAKLDKFNRGIKGLSRLAITEEEKED